MPPILAALGLSSTAGAVGSALGAGSAAVPSLAGATGATGATLGIPTGVGSAATTGLFGTGGQVGLGGALPQLAMGYGGVPPQTFGFDPRTIGFGLGTAQRAGQAQDPIEMLRQIVLALGRS